MKTIDMQYMRYLNLFEKVTGVRTKNCFPYNNMLVYCVPSAFVSKAIGEGGNNIRKLSEILGKKIKVIPFPCKNVYEFVSKIIEPLKFKSLEVSDREIIINAGRQSKAALIGRNKIRLDELNEILKEYCNKEVKVI